MYVVITIILLIAVISIVLIKAHRKSSTPIVQEASTTCTNLLPLLYAKSEKKFEKEVQVLLEVLDKDVIFVIENRARQLEAKNSYYTSLYSSQIEKLSKCLEGIISSTPKKIAKRKRFMSMQKRIRFCLNINEPLRFFILLESDHDETLFMEFYEFIIEKDLEVFYRKRIQRAAYLYCQIKETIHKINETNNDLLSFNQFLADNATLIEAIRAM